MPDAPTAPAVAPVTEIPAFRDAAGELRPLRAKDFPKTKAGRQALFNFRAEYFESIASHWRQRATDIDKADDPKYQKEMKRKRLLQQLAKLEAELGE